jgi:glycosyltransferase involved in cell wall biosynthesis
MAARDIELTILMPCLNEVRTIGICIRKAQQFLQRTGIHGEILIADNGSSDGSQSLALELGARVVDVPTRGYGAALMAGIQHSAGRFVIMGDSDDSYDFSRLDDFVASLRSGAELVIGNRFRGGIEAGAMPPLHRYLGNPVLSYLGRLFFRIPLGDFHCGLRGCSRDAVLRLGLVTPGMEFASEMIAKAALAGLRIAEVPTTLRPDGRDRPPHLRTWRDGWRHLRFLVLFCPRWLFLYPGVGFFFVGVLGFIMEFVCGVFLSSDWVGGQ